MMIMCGSLQASIPACLMLILKRDVALRLSLQGLA